MERYVKNASRIIIPDNPPPYTISEYSIGDVRAMGLGSKVEFVGSFVDTTPVQSGGKEHIFAPISGPPGTRGKLLKTLLPILEKLKTKCIISLGTPGKKVTAQIGNCQLYTWMSAEERAEAMRNAKFVIFSGGHATCFETIKYAKPTICIPTQPEQLGNAAKLQDMNCSITAKNKKELKKAIQRMEREQDAFDRSVLALNKFSNKFKGLDRAASIVQTMLED